jgi:pyridoxal 5'-phosphate synthase pdxT subunit
MAAVVGVLALQGDFEAHVKVLASLGARAREIRCVSDIDGVTALVLLGGESATITLGVARERLREPLRDLCARVPVLATCAGMIMLDRDHLGVLDMRCERNAFGRQVRSFEGDVSLEGFAEPFHAIFIRAPWVAERAADIAVLADYEGHPVAISHGRILAVAFHPELEPDDRLHRWLLAQL